MNYRKYTYESDFESQKDALYCGNDNISYQMKKWHCHKKEHPFASKYHYHMYIFDNLYPNYDKTRKTPITFQGGIF